MPGDSMRYRPLLLPALVLLQPALAMAAADSDSVAVFDLATLVKLLLSLALIVVLIVALGWYARRLQGFTAGKGGTSLQVLAATPVGAKERVVLLRVGNEQLLLGVAPGSVALLGKVDERSQSLAPPDAGGFTRVLREASAEDAS